MGMGILAGSALAFVLACPALATDYTWVATSAQAWNGTYWTNSAGGGPLVDAPYANAADTGTVGNGKTINAVNGTTFAGQLNLNTGSVLTWGNLQTITTSDLHLNGGQINVGNESSGGSGSLKGTITVDANSKFNNTKYNDYYTYPIQASISGSAGLNFISSAGGLGAVHISGNNSGYSGTWTIDGKFPVMFEYDITTAASGSGSIVIANSSASAIFHGYSDWTVHNNLRGYGKVTFGGGSNTRTLTVSGADVNPGISGGTTNAGILTFENFVPASLGHVAFAQDGSTYSSLTVDVTGTNAVAGTDYDQLKMTNGNLSALDKADLVVNVGAAFDSLKTKVYTGPTLTIVNLLNGSVSGWPFHSVAYTPGWTGTVAQVGSTVTLQLSSLAQAHPGTVVLVY